MELIILSVTTFFSTFFGGMLAVRLKNRLNGIMAFAAGVIVGVVFFEVFPEIINQITTYGFSSIEVMVALVVGFLLFHILEKVVLIHHSHESNYADHKHPDVGVLSALALAGHSFMDGIGIGLGFQISPAVGLLVAVAVIAHDFTDGMNTVTLMLSHKNTTRKSIMFLLLDAVAPLLGALSTLFFQVSPYVLFLYLGFFAGFLLYIGASDILPEAHSKYSSLRLIGLTILGVVLIFIISRLA